MHIDYFETLWRHTVKVHTHTHEHNPDAVIAKQIAYAVRERWSLTEPHEPTLARSFMCKSNLILIHCWVNWRWRQSQINFASTRFDQFPDQSMQGRDARWRNTFCGKLRGYTTFSPMPHRALTNGVWRDSGRQLWVSFWVRPASSRSSQIDRRGQKQRSRRQKFGIF